MVLSEQLALFDISHPLVTLSDTGHMILSFRHFLHFVTLAILLLSKTANLSKVLSRWSELAILPWTKFLPLHKEICFMMHPFRILQIVLPLGVLNGDPRSRRWRVQTSLMWMVLQEKWVVHSKPFYCSRKLIVLNLPDIYLLHRRGDGLHSQWSYRLDCNSALEKHEITILGGTRSGWCIPWIFAWQVRLYQCGQIGICKRFDPQKFLIAGNRMERAQYLYFLPKINSSLYNHPV